MRLAVQNDQGAPSHADSTEEFLAAASRAETESLELPTMAIPAVAHEQAADEPAPASQEEPVAVAEAEPEVGPTVEAEADTSEEAPADEWATEEFIKLAESSAEQAQEAASEPEQEIEPEPEPEPAVESEPEPEAVEAVEEVEEIEESAVADVSQPADDLADVDEPTGMYDQFSSAPSPFVVLQQDQMGFHRDRSDEGWEAGAAGSQRFVPGGQRRLQEDIEQQSGPPMLIVAGVAVAIMVTICAVLFRVFGLSRDVSTDTDTVQLVGTVVEKDEAEEVIASLDGWWKTDRELDGRYWHIEKKSVQTYAADGKLASENMLDTTKVERMNAGPGGIDKPGYYLRDVGFYLADDNPDILFALAADGSADADANLLRTEEPNFQSEEKKEEEEVEEEQPDESEYVLPESATRVYEYGELDSMDDYNLYLARNEIYARHGYVFEEGSEMANYFSQKSWYQPNEYYSEYDLSDIENQNIDLIRSVEYNHNSQYQWS